MEAKAVTNPEEIQVEKDTAKKGSYRTQGVKGWKNLENCVEQDSHERPTRGVSVKQASKEKRASQTNPTPKGKNKTQGKEDVQEGAGSQTTRKEP